MSAYICDKTSKEPKVSNEIILRYNGKLQVIKLNDESLTVNHVKLKLAVDASPTIMEEWRFAFSAID
jgi:hypothetical protein